MMHISYIYQLSPESEKTSARIPTLCPMNNAKTFTSACANLGEKKGCKGNKYLTSLRKTFIEVMFLII